MLSLSYVNPSLRGVCCPVQSPGRNPHLPRCLIWLLALVMVPSLSEVVESGHSWSRIWGQGAISLLSQQGAQGFVWPPYGAWRVLQIFQFSEIIPLLLRGTRKFTELFIFLDCFPCHITVVAFGLLVGLSDSLGHGHVSRPDRCAGVEILSGCWIS